MKAAHENKAKVSLLCLPKDTTPTKTEGEFHYKHAVDSLLTYSMEQSPS
jgi:hypothetical protein